MIKVLVVGGGAREHAICSAVCKSEDSQLYTVMHNRNPGIIRLSKDYRISKETDVEKVVEFALDKGIDLAIIGPEAPLEKGLTDELMKRGIKVCSPTRDSARIETDKEWMRKMMSKYKIPGQVRNRAFDDPRSAEEFIRSLNGNVAVKPIGLTGGKGVKVAGDHLRSVEDAVNYAREVIEKRIGGKARVLIEEKLEGEEFTLQAFSDGKTIFPMPAVQDHKRLLPSDEGPNTGGMGSYSSEDGILPFMSRSDYEEGVHILQRVVESLRKEGHPFIGVIYGQFMLTRDGAKIVEINARFGDPEAMNVLPLLKGDYVDICFSMVEGNLTKRKIGFERKATVCKYVVPEGYGVKSMVDQPIDVDEKSIEDEGAILFYASVNERDGKIYTTSSRSLAVVGIGEDIEDAERICERGLKHVKGEHIFIRHDIGKRELIEKRIEHMRRLRGSI
ncbi:MAG TPA: phosphoribosylamine--glycine ligase [Thermoplasmatales archaeon]|nr:phosphoribosylamine--glycine ligase [Thermoplasmatales archaeon]HEX17593.1 phosphoribosylamine--glycine ligase [Thermoplasmatales archaeon]